MNRALTWALSPAPPLFVLALQYWDLRRSPDLPDMWVVWSLLAVSVSAIASFGAMPRRFWWLAGVLAATTVYGFALVGMKLNIALRITGGVPEAWLLELSAATIVLAIPVALVVGAVASFACARTWIARD